MTMRLHPDCDASRATASRHICNSIAVLTEERYEPVVPSRLRITTRRACLAFAWTLAIALAACTRLAATPSPREVETIAVFPVDNRTGGELFADAPPLTDIFGHVPRGRITAADILTDELRQRLAARGFRVVAPEALRAMAGSAAVRSTEQAAGLLAENRTDADGLFVRLWKWDAIAPSHLVYVDVKLDATLVAPDGRVLWTAELPATPIDGGAASSAALGYPEVARRVAELLTANLAPARARR